MLLEMMIDVLRVLPFPSSQNIEVDNKTIWKSSRCISCQICGSVCLHFLYVCVFIGIFQRFPIPLNGRDLWHTKMVQNLIDIQRGHTTNTQFPIKYIFLCFKQVKWGYGRFAHPPGYSITLTVMWCLTVYRRCNAQLTNVVRTVAKSKDL